MIYLDHQHNFLCCWPYLTMISPSFPWSPVTPTNMAPNRGPLPFTNWVEPVLAKENFVPSATRSYRVWYWGGYNHNTTGTLLEMHSGRSILFFSPSVLNGPTDRATPYFKGYVEMQTFVELEVTSILLAPLGTTITLLKSLLILLRSVRTCTSMACEGGK